MVKFNAFLLQKLVLILSLSISSRSVFGQLSLGFAAGFAKNTVNTNAYSVNNLRHRHSYGVSAKLQSYYTFNKWLALQADVEYIQKNIRIERYGFYEGVYTKRKNSYLQVPVSARLSFAEKRLRGFINLGCYGGFWLAGRSKGVDANILSPLEINEQNPSLKLLDITAASAFDEKYQFNKNRDNRWELGYLLGGGVQYMLKPSITFFVQARYYYGVTSQQKEAGFSPVRLYNETVDVSAGITYSFSKKDKVSHPYGH